MYYVLSYGRQFGHLGYEYYDCVIQPKRVVRPVGGNSTVCMYEKCTVKTQGEQSAS